MENANESSFLYLNHIKEITLGIRIALSGIGILLYLLVMAVILYPKCKTSIKLVLSLSFANLILAAFLMFLFIVFATPWTNYEQTFTKETSDGNETRTGNKQVGLVGTPDVLGKNIRNSV